MRCGCLVFLDWLVCLVVVDPAGFGFWVAGFVSLCFWFAWWLKRVICFGVGLFGVALVCLLCFATVVCACLVWCWCVYGGFGWVFGLWFACLGVVWYYASVLFVSLALCLFWLVISYCVGFA